MSQNVSLNQSYSYAALMIVGTQQNVTVDKLEVVFKALNLEFSRKIASFYCLTYEEYKGLMNVRGGAPAASNAPAAGAPVEAQKEEVVEEEEELELEFDF